MAANKNENDSSSEMPKQVMTTAEILASVRRSVPRAPTLNPIRAVTKVEGLAANKNNNESTDEKTKRVTTTAEILASVRRREPLTIIRPKRVTTKRATLATNRSNNDHTNTFIIGVIISIVVFASMLKRENSGTSRSGTFPRSIETTEGTLRRVYDSQGIKHDDRMIREDSRAIEKLHREFGK